MHRHRWIDDVQNNTSVARFLTIPNQGRRHRPPMQMNNGTMRSLFAISQFAVDNFGYLIDFIYSLQVGGWKVLLTKLGLASVSKKLTTVNNALNLAPIEILTR